MRTLMRPLAACVGFLVVLNAALALGPRNQAAHHKGFSIDADQALEYARLTKRVLDALNEEPARIPGVQVPG
jgi:hypothetical protein